jgi:chorismate mutase / prephenate dehydratase
VAKKTKNDIVEIGYQGEECSNSHLASKMFSKKIKNSQLFPMVTSESVVDFISEDNKRYGVVAVKNNIGGVVSETKNALSGIDFDIVDELTLRIDHCLCMPQGSNYVELDKVYSHPQALLQCSQYLTESLPGVSEVAFEDTALAAKQLAQDMLPPNSAVICNREAAKKYGLQIIDEDLCNSGSFTKFILFKKKKNLKSTAH